MKRLHLPLLIAVALSVLTGCELTGGESAEVVAARREAEGKAVGGACRHAGRAIEDCFALNKRADKAAVFAGWREMNDYMRENKVETVVPQAAPAPSETAAKADLPGTGDDAAKAPAKARKGEKGDKPAKADKADPAKADAAPAKHES